MTTTREIKSTRSTRKSVFTKSKETRRTITIETEFTVAVYDWNAALLDWYESDDCTDPFDPNWLSVWPQIRDNAALFDQFLNRALHDELAYWDFSWPELISAPAIPSWEEIAAQLNITTHESLSIGLAYAVVLSYDRATLRTPEETRSISLAGISDLGSRKPELKPGTVLLGQKTGHITAQVEQIIRDEQTIRERTSGGLFGDPSDSTLRLRNAVRSTPEVLSAMQTGHALHDVYDSWVMDEGVFSRIANAFAPEEETTVHDDYLQMLPAIRKLSAEDQKIFANYDAGKYVESFGLPASFVLDLFETKLTKNAALTISAFEAVEGVRG
jgi:hypothetical protein